MISLCVSYDCELFMNRPKRSKKKFTLIATEEGVEKAKKALIRLGFESQINFAEAGILMSRSTVSKFFNRKPIQLDSFKRICEGLGGLRWQEIGGISETKPQGIIKIKDPEQSSKKETVSASTTTTGIQVTVHDKRTKIKKVVITLQGDIESVSNIKILQSILREYSGNTIEIEDIKPGSIKIFLEGSQEDIDNLIAAIKSKKLTQLDSFLVEDIVEVDEEAETAETIDKWQLVKEIRNQPIKNRNLIGVDLSDVNLSGAELSSADLSGADLSGADLSDADLSGADLSGVWSNISGAWANARSAWANARSAWANARSAWANASLAAERAERAAELSELAASRAELSELAASLSELAELAAERAAELSELAASLSELAERASLSELAELASFAERAERAAERAELASLAALLAERAELASLSELASFAERAERAAELSELAASRAELSELAAELVELTGTKLTNARLVKANLAYSQLNDVNLAEANLIGANLNNAELLRANLTNADLSGANVKNARFGYNKGISESLRIDLVKRGAIFEDSPPGDRSKVLTRV